MFMYAPIIRRKIYLWSIFFFFLFIFFRDDSVDGSIKMKEMNFLSVNFLSLLVYLLVCLPRTHNPLSCEAFVLPVPSPISPFHPTVYINLLSTSLTYGRERHRSRTHKRSGVLIIVGAGSVCGLFLDVSMVPDGRFFF